MTCECGQEAWILGVEPVIVSVEIEGKMRHDKGHKLAMMTCDECGRVEFYHIEAVNRAVARVRENMRAINDVTPTD